MTDPKKPTATPPDNLVMLLDMYKRLDIVRDNLHQMDVLVCSKLDDVLHQEMIDCQLAAATKAPPPDDEGLRWHPELRCGLIRAEIGNRTVTMYLPEGQCTDMCGAIALAKKLNPGVTEIHTIAGTRTVNRYELAPHGWQSYR